MKKFVLVGVIALFGVLGMGTIPDHAQAQTMCQDGVDNDGDGFADFGTPNITEGDFSCFSKDDADETSPKAECQDGIDNDGDGKVDFGSDGGCSTLNDNVERDLVCPSGVTPQRLTELVLSTSQFGAGLSSQSVSLNKGTYLVEYNEGGWGNGGQWFGLFNASFPGGSFQIGSQAGFPTQLAARNVSNERFEVATLTSAGTLTLSLPGGSEGRLSAFVYQCQDTSKPQCSDFIDNDGDGKIDYPADSGCESPDDDDEDDDKKPQCSDGKDNDDDGLEDEDDPGCHDDQDINKDYNPDDDDERNGQCSDKKDNDGDGFIDKKDPDCHTDNDANDGDDTFDGSRDEDTNNKKVVKAAVIKVAPAVPVTARTGAGSVMVLGSSLLGAAGLYITRKLAK